MRVGEKHLVSKRYATIANNSSIVRKWKKNYVKKLNSFLKLDMKINLTNQRKKSRGNQEH